MFYDQVFNNSKLEFFKGFSDEINTIFSANEKTTVDFSIIHQEVYTKWCGLDGEAGLLGEPIETIETTIQCSDGEGAFVQFQGGRIYWTRYTGAHGVHGVILEKWLSLGGEKSLLGYPISDEYEAPDGKTYMMDFQCGRISYCADTKRWCHCSYSHNSNILLAH
ncbi:LGFP repeat-containing protein [Thiofilum flexile]|uniref:LGFP repeat-containing protein n=1 Tax=Thiofilum flexile TaxID=125627 RepID=UPI00037C5C87|nr:hypothetical protein [Thiofilum flexile]